MASIETEQFSRAATDQEREAMKLPTDDELKQALADGEKQRAAVVDLQPHGTAVAPRVLFK